MLANERLSCGLHIGKSKEQVCKNTMSSMSKNQYDTGINANRLKAKNMAKNMGKAGWGILRKLEASGNPTAASDFGQVGR